MKAGITKVEHEIDVAERVQPHASAIEPNAEVPSHTPGVLAQLGRSTFWLWLDRGGLKIGSMIAGLLLVRYLGPANYGEYVKALAAGAVAAIAIDFGLTRFIARTTTAGARPQVVAASLLTTLAFLAIEFAVASFAAVQHQTGLLIMALGFILTNLEGTSSFCAATLTSDLRSRQVVVGSVMSVTGVISVIALVIHFRLTVVGLLTAMIAKSCVVVALRFWQIRRFAPRLRELSWRTTSAAVKRAWPFYSYALTQIGYEKISVLCFALIALPEQVGVFSAAIVLAGVFPQWTYAAADALLPVLSRLVDTGRANDLLELKQRLLDVLLVICVPVAVALAVFAPQICEILGPRFVASAPVLRITASRCVLGVLEGFFGDGFLTAIERMRERRNAQARSLVVLALLTVVLGAGWGARGAATAMLVADILLIGQYVKVLSRGGLKTHWMAAGPVVIAGAAMAFAALRGPSIPLVVRPFSALAVYVAVLAIFARRQLITTGRTIKQAWTGA